MRSTLVLRAVRELLENFGQGLVATASVLVGVAVRVDCGVLGQFPRQSVSVFSNSQKVVRGTCRVSRVVTEKDS